MKSERVLGTVLIIIPLLIIMGFIFKNPQFWILVDFVVIFITTIIGLLLLLKKNQLNQELTESIVRILLPTAVLVVSVVSFYNSKTADNRIERLYQAQRASDIQVTPISFTTLPRPEKADMGSLSFKLINYTGFKAFNVRVDACFIGTSWIYEWIINTVIALEEKKKNGESLTDELEEELKLYKKYLEQNPYFEIKPNEIKIIDRIGGEFDYKQKGENKIRVRVLWDNENSAHFDKIYVFSVERVEAYGKQSYVLIPVTN